MNSMDSNDPELLSLLFVLKLVWQYLILFLIKHYVTLIIKCVALKHEYVLQVVKSIFEEQISAWCVRGTIARFKNNNGLNGWKKWNRGAEKPTSKVWSRARCVEWGEGKLVGETDIDGDVIVEQRTTERITLTYQLISNYYSSNSWFIVVLLIYWVEQHNFLYLNAIKPMERIINFHLLVIV